MITKMPAARLRAAGHISRPRLHLADVNMTLTLGAVDCFRYSTCARPLSRHSACVST